MPLPAAIPIIGAGVGILGDILGGGGGGIPQELLDELQGRARDNRADAFLPDRGAFETNLQAQIDDILAQLPAGQEAFNAQAASRGVFTGGESLSRLYSDVYAPIARAGTSAVARGELGFAEATQRGRIAGSQQQQQYYNLLINAMLNREPTTLERIGGGLSDLGSFGVNAYIASLSGD